MRLAHASSLLVRKTLSEVTPGRQQLNGGMSASDGVIGYALHRSRSHDAVIRVYDAAGNLIETHEQT
jgi:hypothetical protein